MFKLVAMQQDGNIIIKTMGADMTEDELMQSYVDYQGRKDISFVNLMQRLDTGRWVVKKYRHDV